MQPVSGLTGSTNCAGTWWNSSTVRVGLVLASTAIIGSAIALHAPGVNGAWYWKWAWRKLPAFRTIAVTFLCALPLFAAHIAFHKRRISASGAIAWAAFAVLLLQFALSGLNSPGFDLTRTWKIIVDPATTSYFTDASRLVGHDRILASYPELLDGQLIFHSLTKPPGPVVFYVGLIEWFGLNQAAALAGAFVLAIFAAAGVPAAFFLFRALGASVHAAVHGATALALCTGPVVFFPEFDQAYLVFTCLFLGLWCLALNNDRVAYSLVCGGVLSVGLFFAYHVLVLGLFIVASALVFLDVDRSLRRCWIITKHGLVALSAVVAAYVALWLRFGFNSGATLAVAVSNQELMKAKFAAAGARLYPETIFPDLVDFALGMSWLPAIVAPIFMIALHRRLGGGQLMGFGWACLLQIAVVILSGQIGETARTLIFLIPLGLFPVCLELERWSLSERLVFFGAMTLLLALNFQNMVFLSV